MICSGRMVCKLLSQSAWKEKAEAQNHSLVGRQQWHHITSIKSGMNIHVSECVLCPAESMQWKDKRVTHLQETSRFHLERLLLSVTLLSGRFWSLSKTCCFGPNELNVFTCYFWWCNVKHSLRFYFCKFINLIVNQSLRENRQTDSLFSKYKQVYKKVETRLNEKRAKIVKLIHCPKVGNI